jgi:hypothetical protein
MLLMGSGLIVLLRESKKGLEDWKIERLENLVGRLKSWKVLRLMNALRGEKRETIIEKQEPRIRNNFALSPCLSPVAGRRRGL